MHTSSSSASFIHSNSYLLCLTPFFLYHVSLCAVSSFRCVFLVSPFLRLCLSTFLRLCLSTFLRLRLSTFLCLCLSTFLRLCLSTSFFVSVSWVTESCHHRHHHHFPIWPIADRRRRRSFWDPLPPWPPWPPGPPCIDRSLLFVQPVFVSTIHNSTELL